MCAVDVDVAYDLGIGRYSTPLARAFVDALPLRAPDGVLDVGCGTGALTGVLAARFGAAAVAAVDPSEEYVAACRERVPGADVRAGRAERLPFRDGRFDAVLAQLVLNLVTDRAQAARELARVVRPDGLVAASGWAEDEMPFLQAFWEAAEAVAPERVSAIPRHERVGSGSADTAALLAGAGLDIAATGDIHVEAEYVDVDDLWTPFEAGAGRSGALYRALEPERRSALRAHAVRRLGAPAGRFRLAARAWYVVARAKRGRGESAHRSA
jgi:ubiquinone/menaquinone biosynthesis C-methylase UbiE